MELEHAIQAYLNGYFPMAHEGELQFYECDPRSIYTFDLFHTPRRLKRIFSRSPFDYRFDQDFKTVVEGCRHNRDEWISDELQDLYLDLHDLGIAHSIEAWHDDRLVGGIYGTHFGAAFLAESMFHIEEHASNCCLLFLVDHLHKRGFHFIDIQYPNPHTARFNPQSLAVADYRKKYQLAQSIQRPFK